jgi:hypothetical protein
VEDWIECKLDELMTAGLSECDVIDAVKQSEAAASRDIYATKYCCEVTIDGITLVSNFEGL